MNIDVADARALLALVDTGSVSGAAIELRLTQPAVTRRLQRLELAVGAPLMDRQKRPFAPTEIGAVAVERCRRLVAAAEELRAIGQCVDAPAREVRIGVAHALTEFALVEPIEALSKSFPTLTMRLHAGWSRDLIAKVRSGVLDAACVLLAADDTAAVGVETAPLADDEIVIIAANAKRSQRNTPRLLADGEWILSPDGCAGRAALQKRLAQAGLPLRVAVETYNYDLQMSLVARGRGLGFVPRRLLERNHLHGQIKMARPRGFSFPMTILTVTSTLAPSLKPPLQMLGTLLAERLGRERIRSLKQTPR